MFGLRNSIEIGSSLSPLHLNSLLERNTERENTGSAKGNQVGDVHFVFYEEALGSRGVANKSVVFGITCHGM